MIVQQYADKETAKEIRAAVKASDGHCPCVFEEFRNADTKCMCKDFRDMPEGSICNCGLYIKIKN